MTPPQSNSSPTPPPAAAITQIISTGSAPAPQSNSLVSTLKGKLRSRGAMMLVAAIGLSAIGAKLFWPDAPKLNAVQASAVKAPNKNAKAAPLTKKDKDAAKSDKPSAKSKVANAEPLTTEKAEKQSAAASSSKVAKKSTKVVEPAVEEAPVAEVVEKPAPAERPTRAATAAPKPATAPPAAAAPSASSAAKKPIVSVAARPADPLGPAFIDETNGYSIRFPAGWSIRTFNGEPWVIDSGDGRSGLISIGFSPFPTGFTTESIPPEWIARRIKRRTDTVLHGQGYSLVGGKRALWSKSTGPLPMTHANPRMTRVNYILPTGDGRVLELRVAAAPDQFDRLVPVMKKAVETFRLVPTNSPEPVAAAGH